LQIVFHPEHAVVWRKIPLTVSETDNTSYGHRRNSLLRISISAFGGKGDIRQTSAHFRK
jgi:hypothetical protein